MWLRLMSDYDLRPPSQRCPIPLGGSGPPPNGSLGPTSPHHKWHLKNSSVFAADTETHTDHATLLTLFIQGYKAAMWPNRNYNNNNNLNVYIRQGLMCT